MPACTLLLNTKGWKMRVMLTKPTSRLGCFGSHQSLQDFLFNACNDWRCWPVDECGCQLEPSVQAVPSICHARGITGRTEPSLHGNELGFAFQSPGKNNPNHPYMMVYILGKLKNQTKTGESTSTQASLGHDAQRLETAADNLSLAVFGIKIGILSTYINIRGQKNKLETNHWYWTKHQFTDDSSMKHS